MVRFTAFAGALELIRDASQRVTHYLSLQNAIAGINVAHDEFTRQAKLLHMAENTMRFGSWTVISPFISGARY